MATWPASLPQTLLQQGYQETFEETRVRTQMDAGPAKMRRRYTAGVRPITAQSNMSTTQVADLRTFYKTTLLGGTQPFDWTDPIPGGTVSFRFVAPPTVEPLSKSLYRVKFSLEVMP